MKSVAYSCLLVLGVLVLRCHDRFSPSVEVVFWDVGQGDSAFIRLPYGKVILVDGGDGYFLPSGRAGGAAGAELFRELTRKAVQTVDGLILTHGDRDHGFGFFTLFEHFTINRFTFAASLKQGEGHSRFHELLKKVAEIHGVRQEVIATDTVLEESGVRMTLLPAPEGKWARNNQSLVMRMDFGHCAILFTGDIEQKREAELLNHLVSVDILKVAHHGSRTSSTTAFLRRTRPRVAVISAGRDNRYGHPHEEVVWRLQQAGTQVLRTDFHGYVSFTISPQGTVACRSFQGDCGHFGCRSNSHLPLLKN